MFCNTECMESMILMILKLLLILNIRMIILDISHIGIIFVDDSRSAPPQISVLVR